MNQQNHPNLWRILPSFLVVMLAIGAGGWMAAQDSPGRTVLEDVHQAPELPTMPVFGERNPQGYYIGLDPQGWMTLYQGPPPQGKVIKTFYQIKIDSLESGLPRDSVVRLYQGIKLQDVHSFTQILSEYEPYAVRPSP